MSEFERNKDRVQAGVQAGASLVGRITMIVTDAIGSIAREVGDFVTDGIEMREAARISRHAEQSGASSIDLTGSDGTAGASGEEHDDHGDALNR